MHAVSLADVRLLKRAQAGEPAAHAQLWADWRDTIWSTCRAMTASDVTARALLDAHYQHLPTAVRQWPRDQPLCCLVAHWSHARIHQFLQLPPLTGITMPAATRAAPPLAKDIPTRLALVPPAIRLVYLLDLFYGCPAPTMASLLGVAETELRLARATAAWTLLTPESP